MRRISFHTGGKLRIRWRALAAVGIAVAAVGSTITVATASANDNQSRQAPVLRPRFRNMLAASWIWTGARFALVGPAQTTAKQAATLIDDETGKRMTIGREGCEPVQPSGSEPLDLPWVPFNCGTATTPAPELYSPTTGRWQQVPPSQAITNPCGSHPCEVQYSLTAAGRYWLEYARSDCPLGEHCSYRNVFQNIRTAALRQDPSGGSTTIDLNAPGLTRTVCRPLSVPTAAQVFAGPGPGSLIFYRSFALAIGTDQNANPEVYLERCGTLRHRLITKGPYPGEILLPGADTHEVVSMAQPRPFLTGLTLPAMKPFTIKLPTAMLGGACSPPDYTTCVSQIALTEHAIYLLITPTSRVWAAPVPLPKTPTRRCARPPRCPSGSASSE